ncbi:major facilitator superfamily transporter [Rhizoctonia solani]|uniref:Major facilitator superfamily transporter n=1 Tax=Rhizoctonia solani TaxID=456999 RepID=A0A8H8SU59_9AGAM|nr:major facilitator superfamily transporter [Rhizoctonia solani]QRW17894.1 major facilitator superfamily transporter [Rhizoctonia solani]
MSSPYNEKKDIERESADLKKDPAHHVTVVAAGVDDAVRLTLGQGTGQPLDPEAALKLRKKIDRHLLPLMMIRVILGTIYGQDTLGSSAILGIRADTHLDANHKTWSTCTGLSSISPTSCSSTLKIGLQRFPVGKWMAANITCWGIALIMHAACKNFGGLMACRIVLGICEGSITAGFMIVTSMFYTRKEQSIRVGYWFLMNGTAQIISGFLALGSYILIPMATAWFLTTEERAMAIERIKVNQTGVKQSLEERPALTDPKTWLFALFSCLDNIPNSLTNQRSIIVNSFGFSTLQTTLLGCVDGVIEIVTIWTGVTLAVKWEDSRAYVAVLYFIPNVLGSILVNVLPWSNKIGLLFSVWITGVGTTGFVLSLGWAIMLSAYCVGNLVGPQMWQERYKPRLSISPLLCTGTVFHGLSSLSATSSVPSFFSSFVSSFTREQERDAEPKTEEEDDAYIEETLQDGTKVERKVDKAFLDLTDIQNRDFRYVL